VKDFHQAGKGGFVFELPVAVSVVVFVLQVVVFVLQVLFSKCQWLFLSPFLSFWNKEADEAPPLEVPPEAPSDMPLVVVVTAVGSTQRRDDKNPCLRRPGGLS